MSRLVETLRMVSPSDVFWLAVLLLDKCRPFLFGGDGNSVL